MQFKPTTRWLAVLMSAAAAVAACSASSSEPGGGAGGADNAGRGGAGGSSNRGGAAAGGAGSGGSAGASSGGGAGSGGASGSGGAAGAGAGGAPGTGGGGGATGGGGGTAGAAADAASEAGSADMTSTPADAPVGTGPMVLTSSVFKAGGPIAAKYRCKHENLSPPLEWTPGPTGTLSYAVTMLHANSIHWVLWDIPATTTSLPLDVAKLAQPPIPVGSKQVKPNIDGATWYGYTGPCPASSSHYEYYVYALKVASLPGVTPESAPKKVDDTIKANMLGRAELSGTAAANAP